MHDMMTTTMTAAAANHDAELGVSEGAVRVAVHRLRRRYREVLREQISQTLSDPANVAEEMQALFSAFAP